MQQENVDQNQKTKSSTWSPLFKNKQNNTYMFVKRLSYHMCFEKYTHKLGAMKQTKYLNNFFSKSFQISSFFRWNNAESGKKCPMSQQFEPWNDRSMSQFSRLGSLFWCPVLVGFKALKNISGSVPYLFRQHTIFIILRYIFIIYNICTTFYHPSVIS